MDVYLVPAGPSRYALYCEAGLTPASSDDAPPATLWARLVASFRRAVDEGDAEARGLAAGEERGRLRRLITRKLAETVAEQRLLWSLRGKTAATLVHPDDIDSDRALALAHAEFAADFARHRRWLVIDALLTAVTGPVFFFIPGPNLVSWYFSFRAVGHYFSMKGARQGLSVVAFMTRPSPELSSVADALRADRKTRETRVEAAAAALGLDRLASFVERIADRA